MPKPEVEIGSRSLKGDMAAKTSKSDQFLILNRFPVFPIPVANRKYRFQTGNRSKNDVSVSKTPKSVYFSILNLFSIFSYTFANWKYLVQAGMVILSRKFQIGVILNFQSICGVSKTKLNIRFRRILFFFGVNRN